MGIDGGGGGGGSEGVVVEVADPCVVIGSLNLLFLTGLDEIISMSLSIAGRLVGLSESFASSVSLDMGV